MYTYVCIYIYIYIHTYTYMSPAACAERAALREEGDASGNEADLIQYNIT